MKLSQINVKLESPYKEQVQKLSKDTGIPQAQLIRRALSEFLTRYGYWDKKLLQDDQPQTPPDRG